MNPLKKVFPSEWFEEDSTVPAENPEEIKEVQPPVVTINLSRVDSAPKVIRKPIPEKLDDITVSSGKPDPEYSKFVLDFLEKENQEGVEYFEFSAAARESIEAGTPVQNAFISTFKSLKYAGLTYDRLVETNQYYISRLENLDKEFCDEADGQVSQKETEAKEAVDEITSNQIKLQKESGQIRKRLEQIDKEVVLNTTKLASFDQETEKVRQSQASRKTRMQTTVAYFSAIIADDLEKIRTYLKQ